MLWGLYRKVVVSLETYDVPKVLIIPFSGILTYFIIFFLFCSQLKTIKVLTRELVSILQGRITQHPSPKSLQSCE